jgi:hypothetical protein
MCPFQLKSCEVILSLTKYELFLRATLICDWSRAKALFSSSASPAGNHLWRHPRRATRMPPLSLNSPSRRPRRLLRPPPTAQRCQHRLTAPPPPEPPTTQNPKSGPTHRPPPPPAVSGALAAVPRRQLCRPAALSL